MNNDNEIVEPASKIKIYFYVHDITPNIPNIIKYKTIHPLIYSKEIIHIKIIRSPIKQSAKKTPRNLNCSSYFFCVLFHVSSI